MRKNKFRDFYTIENNTYSILSLGGDLYLGTTSFMPISKRRKINQGFKALELTVPISYLFNEIINAEVVKEDKDFPDMTTYKRVNNKELRKTLKESYDSVLEEEINQILTDFNNWCNEFREENSAILPEEQIRKTLLSNRNTLNAEIEQIKNSAKANSLIFKTPRITESKDLYNFTQMERVEFLYTQRVGSNLKINYFYDLDDFGVITIYKIQTVRGYIKSIETFIYNKTVLDKMVAYMSKHKL